MGARVYTLTLRRHTHTFLRLAILRSYSRFRSTAVIINKHHHYLNLISIRQTPFQFKEVLLRRNVAVAFSRLLWCSVVCLHVRAEGRTVSDVFHAN